MHQERMSLPLCPMCGLKPASRGDSDWGHNALCCSDACGRAYLDSTQRAERMIADLKEQRRRIDHDIEMWTRQWNAAARAKE